VDKRTGKDRSFLAYPFQDPRRKARIARWFNPITTITRLNRMPEESFSLTFIQSLIDRCLTLGAFEELNGPQGPYRSLVREDNPQTEAGYLRLWSAGQQQRLDRMIHLRLQSPPVDTQLFFIFGRADTAMPHFHAQAVQFSADGCVYNTDLIPRLDPVTEPRYYVDVFGPLSKPYWRATNDRQNVCANAPANPAIAAYLSPWSIGTGSPTNQAELDRIKPQIDAYLEHYLELAATFDYVPDATTDLTARNAQHLDSFFADKLDPRAWKGVYRTVGETAGQEIKAIFKTSLN
jgi:hypothetical protein